MTITYNGKERASSLSLLLRERSHITSSLGGGRGDQRMMTIVILLKGNNSNLADMGGGGGQMSENLADT